VKAHTKLSADTAIMITFDEGGGFHDAGYVQPLDLFGGGTRIPMIVVSPFAPGGQLVYDYSDHVSILKFIERNRCLPPITNRSRIICPIWLRQKATPMFRRTARRSAICSACSGAINHDRGFTLRGPGKRRSNRASDTVWGKMGNNAGITEEI
jgi:Phosphoesterase family